MRHSTATIARHLTVLLFVPIAPAALAQDAPPAEVPPPPELTLQSLPAPMDWHLVETRPLLERPLAFSFDLDLLAPLGTGDGNAATWFATLDGGNPMQPAADELAGEAAAWADQARCSFYPDVHAFKGLATPVPDTALVIGIAGVWAAEAGRDPDHAEALGRRIVRLGRLLLTDELSVEQHLAGLECIAIGAAVLYEHGRRCGDGALTTLTQRAIGDVAAQRRLMADWMDVAGLPRERAASRDSLFEEIFGPDLDLSRGEFRQILRLVTSDAHPVLRHDAAMNLALVMTAGTRDQRKRAHETLLMIAADPKDPLSEAAEWWADHPIEADE